MTQWYDWVVVDYNFSHRIINFSFGEPVAGMVNPLEGDEKLTSDRKSHVMITLLLVCSFVSSCLCVAVCLESCQHSVYAQTVKVSPYYVNVTASLLFSV